MELNLAGQIAVGIMTVVSLGYVIWGLQFIDGDKR